MFFRWDAETCNPEVGPGLTKGMAAYLQNETATEILSGWAETSGERQCYPTAFKGSSGVQFHVRIPCDESREASGMMFESGFRNKAFKPGSCRCPSRHRRAPGIPSLSKYRCISERHTHTHTLNFSLQFHRKFKAFLFRLGAVAFYLDDGDSRFESWWQLV